MSDIYLIKPAFTEDTIIYRVQLLEVARLKEVTAGDIDKELDRLGVSQLVIDAGFPHIIERLKRKRLIHQLISRKPAHTKSRASNIEEDK